MVEPGRIGRDLKPRGRLRLRAVLPAGDAGDVDGGHQRGVRRGEGGVGSYSGRGFETGLLGVDDEAEECRSAKKHYAQGRKAELRSIPHGGDPVSAPEPDALRSDYMGEVRFGYGEGGITLGRIPVAPRSGS